MGSYKYQNKLLKEVLKLIISRDVDGLVYSISIPDIAKLFLGSDVRMSTQCIDTK